MRGISVAVATIVIPLVLLGGAPQAAAESDSDSISVPDSVTASFAVYDRHAKRYTIAHNPHEKFRAASVVKLLIALDYLLRSRPPLDLEKATSDEQRLDILALRTMLRGSWDYAASVFWVKGGFNAVIERMVPLIGLADTAPPQDPKIWGYTTTSAADVVTIYNYILDKAPAEYRDFIMGNLHAATRCAEDSRDQSFGLPSVYAPPIGVKQGWSGWGATVPESEKCLESETLKLGKYRGELPASKEGVEPPDLVSPLLHTTGTVGADDRSVVILLTTYPPKTTWRQGASVITTLAKKLKPFVPGARIVSGRTQTYH